MVFCVAMNRQTNTSPLVDHRLTVVKTSKRVRRYWSDEEKRRIVAESQAGHRQVLATARRHGIAPTLLYKWRRDLEEADERSVPAAPPFVPVRVVNDAPAPEPTSGSTSSVGEGRIEIVLANGRRVVVGGGIDPDRLAQVLQVAEAS